VTASAATPLGRAPLLTRVASAIRARSAEALVFSVAAVVALLHALDDAFLLPGDGVPRTQHALAASIALVASVLAVVRFPSLRPGIRAAVAFTFGVLAAVNGGRHVFHIVNEGQTTANDVTGALALAAGVVLVGLAAWIPLRHRGEGASGPVRRWAIRLLVPPALLLAAAFVFMPVGMAIVDIHSLHRSVGSPPDAAYKTASFTTSDDVDLEGWYRPSQNGASVLMISGGGGNRRSTLRHAEMLVRHGYGVLLYDPRGSGNSEGTVNSYGWGWEKDAAAALDFLAERDDVEPGRVGVLGLSTGADIAIDIAARRDDVKAVVADGSAAIGYEDIKAYTDNPLTRVPMWVLFTSIEVIQGRSGPDKSLAEQIARSHAPQLLVSAGKPEKEWGKLYDKAGGARSQLWYLPAASHTAALKQYPEAYEQRVISFLDTNLRAK
jgi:pimeloyl-ACP methyl ester carboxylesterase